MSKHTQTCSELDSGYTEDDILWHNRALRSIAR